jgi:Putative zinc-finger
MRHIDDGQLHAVLDEALHAFDPDEARRIRAHLESCEECRGRLDAERGVHARAAALLTTDDPVADVSLPTLEDMQREAGAREGAARAARRLPLGWAAMIALALGVGYGLGVMDAPGPAAPSVPADGLASVEGAGAAPEQRRAAEPEAPVERLAEAPEKSAAGESAATLESLDRAAPLGSRAREELVRRPADDAPMADQAASMVPVAAETERADADEVGALVLPGATVLAIVRGEVWPGQFGVLVRQRLADGAVVELRIVGERAEQAGITSAPPVAADSDPAGWSRVVREDGRGWLVLAGPLSEARLRELLDSLR